MIGQIRGTLVAKVPPQLCIDVQGIGYEIDVPMTTFDRLPPLGQNVLLYTHLVIREDMHLLFGFFTQEERTLFRTLIKVNGVGPRLGLTILSSLAPSAFAACVKNQDLSALVHIPGIGKKTAERLLIEMRDKCVDWQIEDSQSDLKRDNRQVTQDAISALIALGYKPTEATRAVNKVDNGSMSCEQMIRRALAEKAI